MWEFMNCIGIGGIFHVPASMQNAGFGPIGDGEMLDRLSAAKVALNSPERVERLPSGRGWRMKLTNGQLELSRLMAQYDPRPRTPKGHDHPEWV